MPFKSAYDAIGATNAIATGTGIPWGIAYRNGRGWAPYDLRKGTSDEPEFICLGLGQLPLPLSDEAAQIVAALIAWGQP